MQVEDEATGLKSLGGKLAGNFRKGSHYGEITNTQYSRWGSNYDITA
jgi:hypothetical protein